MHFSLDHLERCMAIAKCFIMHLFEEHLVIAKCFFVHLLEKRLEVARHFSIHLLEKCHFSVYLLEKRLVVAKSFLVYLLEKQLVTIKRFLVYFLKKRVVTPLWGKCEDETHTPKSGNLESSGTLITSELDCKVQNTLPWGVLYTVGKALKCKCRKWPRMSHSDIYTISYGQKKVRESNWQFDSRPLKIGNRPDPSVCRWSATHRWKALEERYKFALNLIPIQGLNRELWAPKVLGVQTRTVSGLLLGSTGNKSHLNAGVAEQGREYYMGEGGGFPRVQAMVSQVSPYCPWLISTPRVFPKVD